VPALTIWSAASAYETLLVMSIVAAIFVPIVLLYQGGSLWVFRERLRRPAALPGPRGDVTAPGQSGAADPEHDRA